MNRFITEATIEFFVALGIVLGGSLLAGVAATFLLQPPSTHMYGVASRIKIWAMVAAVGGTIDPLRVIETNFAEGYISPAVRQILHIIIAFAGAQVGFSIVDWIAKGGGRP